MIKDIEHNGAKIILDSGHTKIFDVDLVNVMKANSFLLLYNLLESTIRKCIEHIHLSIDQDKISYKDSIIEIQKIWVHYKYRNFKDCSVDTIFSVLTQIVDDEISIDYEKYVRTIKSNDLSGNIDAKKVRDLSQKYRFSPNKRVDGTGLVVIKSRRNNLAHGNITFLECGKDYTYNDLNKFKKESVLFLREFLLSINTYTAETQFRK